MRYQGSSSTGALLACRLRGLSRGKGFATRGVGPGAAATLSTAGALCPKIFFEDKTFIGT